MTRMLAPVGSGAVQGLKGTRDEQLVWTIAAWDDADLA
jgi:hypothetical protein